MKNDIEKSLKRWLKNKVKITMSLVTAFLITGSIGYGEDLNRDTILHTGEKGEYTGENITITSKKEGTSGIKDGIWMETGAEVTVSGKNITIDTQTNDGNDGIHFEESGGKITVKDFDNLTIKTGKNGLEGTYGMVSNKNGNIIIAGNGGKDGNSELIINSESNSFSVFFPSPHGAISTGTAYGGGKIDIDVGSIEITCNNDQGIQIFTTNSKEDFKIDTQKIDITSKKGITVGGYVAWLEGWSLKERYGIGYGKITSNSISLDVNEEGILNNSGELELMTGGILISDSKIGISADKTHGEKAIIEIKNNKKNESGEIVENIITNDENVKNGLNITAKEKGLNAINGTITADFIGADIAITTSNDDNNTFGIYAKAGNINLTGDTLNINSTGKDISVSEDFKSEGNNFTVSKLFNATQGIRLEEGATLNLDGINNMNIISSDIAVTANNSNFTFDGTSYFEGNDYLIQGYEETEEKKLNLLVRPVIQAVDKGKINLSGNTTVISRTGTDGEADNVKINNVGIYSQGHTDTGVTGESIVDIEGNLTVISGNDILEEKYPDITKLSELQNLTADELKELISNIDISLMATAGGVINVNSNDNVFLIGDILAGKENSLISVKGGNSNPDSMIVVGEVLAANSGKVGLDMSNGGYFVGRADDYFIIDEFQNTDFRNNKFSTDITGSGEVTLRLGNGAIWNVIGQSYVTHLDFTEGGGVVDLTYEGNALRIKNLSGEGTFNLTLDSEHKDAGNMLYIYNVGNNMPNPLSLLEDNSENKVLTQTVNLTDSVLNLQAGEKLRFATLGKDATGKVQFVANEVKERGINNVSYNTENSAYDVSDEENTIYNGDEANNNKPGNDLINDNETTGFNATENWYLTRGEETINDIGTTIIEMAKSNYANAVYLDNLNKRLGDMTFANGDEGIWVRMRNDRVGEDEHYRLDNFMTQIGYDKKYVMDNGDEHRGIAFEYGRGDLEFKDLIGGEIEADKYVLTLYDTRVRNNGVYTDYTLRAGALSNDFTTYGRETGAKVTGEFKNMLLGAGVEGGKRFDINKNWYFEPQLQAQYTYVGGTDYTTNQGTKVDLDSIHSLIGRAGFRLGHDYYDENGKDNTIYLKTDINREFLGDEKITAKDSTGSFDKTYHNDKTWYDIGIGATKELSPDFTVYTDIEKQFGKHRDSDSWQFNLGFRYRFNSVKDLNPIVMFRDFSLKADNYFDFDKSELKPEGKAVVKKISTELNKVGTKGTLKMEGHTDSIGTREYNQNLSEERAKSVENEFKKNITNEKIQYDTKGYGEDKPIADNTTEEGRAQNRRVDIKFEGTEEQ